MSVKETGRKFAGKFAERKRSAKRGARDDLLCGISKAREQARRREGVSAENARRLVGAWLQSNPHERFH
ncbi:MAG TPA: hypothetical protein VGY56_03945 [Verrucomicrobiae bacterium]|nr:hypothetical protein [Verrucomicrobiae bacterium]